MKFEERLYLSFFRQLISMPSKGSYKTYFIYLSSSLVSWWFLVCIVTCTLMWQKKIQFIKIQDVKDLSFSAYIYKSIFIFYFYFICWSCFIAFFACIVDRWVGVVVEYQIVYQFNDSHLWPQYIVNIDYFYMTGENPVSWLAQLVFINLFVFL